MILEIELNMMKKSPEVREMGNKSVFNEPRLLISDVFGRPIELDMVLKNVKHDILVLLSGACF